MPPPRRRSPARSRSRRCSRAALSSIRRPRTSLAQSRNRAARRGSIPGNTRSIVRRLMSPWTAMTACASPESEISTSNTVPNCAMKRQSARRPVNTQKRSLPRHQTVASFSTLPNSRSSSVYAMRPGRSSVETARLQRIDARERIGPADVGAAHEREIEQSTRAARWQGARGAGRRNCGA